MKLLASVNGQTVDSMPITEVLIKFLEHRLNVFNAKRWAAVGRRNMPHQSYVAVSCAQ